MSEYCFHNPVTVVERKALRNFDDVHWTVQIKTAFTQKIVHISPVFGDRAMVELSGQSFAAKL